jgi:hypothetical protein
VPPRSLTIVAIFIALVLLLELPVLSTALPPMMDYPNHLARMRILAMGGDAYWQVHWGVLPNLAEDAFIWSTSGFLSVETASRVFLFLIVAINAIGVLLFGRALHGDFRLWSLTGLMFIWCASLLWGFLNFSFGVGLAFLGAALWLHLDQRPIVRTLASMPVALLCWFAHIEAFAIYGLLVVGLEAEPFVNRLRGASVREAVCRAASIIPQFIIPVALTLFVWKATASENWELSPFWRKPDLIFTAFNNYNRLLDVFTAIFVIALSVLLLFRRRLTLASRAWPAVLLLVGAFLAAPNHSYSGTLADHRLPPIFLMTFAAASRVRFQTTRGAKLVLGSLLMLFLVRTFVLERAWLASQAVYAKDLAILDKVQAGSAIAVAQPAEAVKLTPAPELHIPLMATVRRDAFVPTLFAFPEQQPIMPTALGAALKSAAEQPFWAAFVDRDSSALSAVAPALAHFDYLVFVARHPFQVPDDVELQLVGETPTFKLFAINRTARSEK